MYKICEHSIAVSIFINRFQTLISHAIEKRHPVNQTDLARFGHPSGSGTKAGYSRKRKSKAKSTSNLVKHARLSSPSKSAVTVVQKSVPTALPKLSPANKTSNKSKQISSSSKPVINTAQKSALPTLTSRPSLSATKSQQSKQILSKRSEEELTKLSKMVIAPDQKSVRIGQSLGPKPAQPEPQTQCYELVLRKGKVSRCNGCNDEFKKEIKDLHVFGRNEFDWYVKIDKVAGTKSYKLGRRNYYYCLNNVVF